MSDIEPAKLKVAELKDLLKERGLDTKGKKDQLVKRLSAALTKEAGGEDNGTDGETSLDASGIDASMECTDEESESPTKLVPPVELPDGEEEAAAEPEEQQPEPVEAASEPAQEEPEAVAEEQAPAAEEPAQEEAKQEETAEAPAEETPMEAEQTEQSEDAKPEEKQEGEEAKAETTEGGEQEGDFVVKDEIAGDDDRQDRKKRSRSRSPRDRHSRRSRSRSPKSRRRSSPQTPRREMEDDSWTQATNVVLDRFNCDLNLKIDAEGSVKAFPMCAEGFAFMWSGARATYGVASGKVYYEVKITQELEVNHLPEEETTRHVVRVGWSTDNTSMQLGEEPQSYGFGGTGKASEDCKFKDFGEAFGLNDVVGCMVDFEEDQVKMSYSKNGADLGVCFEVSKESLGEAALFPHVLSKNCEFICNFGEQEEPFFPCPEGFTFVNAVPVEERVRGSPPPAKKEECEVIMMVGLPGAGKSTWAAKHHAANPEKRYCVLGTNSLIDKMKVMGLPRKRNYAGRWDVLIDKATKALNKLLEIASRKKRNYIIDQTNVYPSAQRRKMRPFEGFQRKAVVIIPTDEEFKSRIENREKEEGKDVPEDAVLEMKANFKLPEEGPNFDSIEFVDQEKEAAEKLVEEYNKEGQVKFPIKPRFSRDDRNRNDNRGYRRDDRHGGRGGNRGGYGGYNRDRSYSGGNRYGGSGGGYRQGGGRGGYQGYSQSDRRGGERRDYNSRDRGRQNYNRHGSGSSSGYGNKSWGSNQGSYNQNQNQGSWGGQSGWGGGWGQQGQWGNQSWGQGYGQQPNWGGYGQGQNTNQQQWSNYYSQQGYGQQGYGQGQQGYGQGYGNYGGYSGYSSQQK